jgi:uncharacterized transporter YbjL
MSRPRPSAPVGPAPPRTFGPHFASVLRELFTQQVAGWRLGVMLVVLALGILVGSAVSAAVGVAGWGVTGVQALTVVVLLLLIAVAVAAARLRNARRR